MTQYRSNPSGPDFSLIICTRNRAERLGACLSHAARALECVTPVELILVDNGSTDRTREVIVDFIHRVPHLSVLVIDEPRPGLSYARNAGVRHAGGNRLIFTDDDCFLDPDYFRNLELALRDYEFDYFSGNILLYRETYGVEGGYLHKQTVERIAPQTILEPGQLQGANMGFSRTVLTRIGGFNTRLGAGTPFRSEDLEFATRASLAGFSGIHLPNVIVVHDHGRLKNSPELRDIVRANSIAGGAYGLEAVFLAGSAGVRYCLAHWRRLLRGFGGGRRRLGWEIFGMISFSAYMMRHWFMPRLKLGGIQQEESGKNGR